MYEKPLLVGAAPGPNTDPRVPLFPMPASSSGGRLLAFSGLSRSEYLTKFERINLLNTWPGANHTGDNFPLELARVAADAIRPLIYFRRVVLIGARVAQAFGIDTKEFSPFEWYTFIPKRIHFGAPPAGNVCYIPHPSGRNSFYRTEESKKAVRDLFRQMVAESLENCLPSGQTKAISTSQT